MPSKRIGSELTHFPCRLTLPAGNSAEMKEVGLSAYNCFIRLSMRPNTLGKTVEGRLMPRTTCR